MLLLPRRYLKYAWKVTVNSCNMTHNPPQSPLLHWLPRDQQSPRRHNPAPRPYSTSPPSKSSNSDLRPHTRALLARSYATEAPFSPTATLSPHKSAHTQVSLHFCFIFTQFHGRSVASVDLFLLRGHWLEPCLPPMWTLWEKIPTLPPWLQMEQELPRLLWTALSAPRPKSKPGATQLFSSPHLNWPSRKMSIKTKPPLWSPPYSQRRPQNQPAPGVLLHLCRVLRNFNSALVQKSQLLALMQWIRQQLMLWRICPTRSPRKRARRPLGNQLRSKAEVSRLQASTNIWPELDHGPARPAFLVVTGGQRAHPVSLLQLQPDPLGPSNQEWPHCRDCAMWVWLWFLPCVAFCDVAEFKEQVWCYPPY